MTIWVRRFAGPRRSPGWASRTRASCGCGSPILQGLRGHAGRLTGLYVVVAAPW